MSNLNNVVQAMIDKLAAGLAADNLTPEDQLLISKALSALQDNAQWEQALIAVAEYHLQTGTDALAAATAVLAQTNSSLVTQAELLVAEARRINENYLVPTANSTLVSGVKYMLPLDTVVKIPADSKPGDVYHIRVCRVKTQVDPAIKFAPIHKGESKVLHRFMATGNKVFVPAGLKANFYGTEVEGNRNVNVLCDMAITNVNGVLLARYLNDEAESESGTDPLVATRVLPSQVITATQLVTPPDGATMAIVSMVGGGPARSYGTGVTGLPSHGVTPAAAAIGVCIPVTPGVAIPVEVGAGGPACLSGNGAGGGKSCFCDAWVGGGLVLLNTTVCLSGSPAYCVPYPCELADAPNVDRMWDTYEACIVAKMPMYDSTCYCSPSGNLGRACQMLPYNMMPALTMDCYPAGEAFGFSVGYPAPLNLENMASQSNNTQITRRRAGVTSCSTFFTNSNTLQLVGMVPGVSMPMSSTYWPQIPTSYCNGMYSSAGCTALSIAWNTWGSLFGSACAVPLSIPNLSLCLPNLTPKGCPGVTTTPCAHQCTGGVVWPGVAGVVEITWI